MKSCHYQWYIVSLQEKKIIMYYSIAYSQQYLIQHSIKPSVQRTAVMDYLLNNRTHPTVDEIFSALSPSMPTLSKTTVYNTLNIFIERGAARMLTIDEKNARYDVDTTPHAHFICQQCGKVYDVFDVNPEVLQLPKNENFKADSVEVFYYGVCNNCSSN